MPVPASRQCLVLQPGEGGGWSQGVMGDLVMGEQRPVSCPTTSGAACIFPSISGMYPAASLRPLTLPPPGGVTWTTCRSAGTCPTIVGSDGTGTGWRECDKDKCPLLGRGGWWRQREHVVGWEWNWAFFVMLALYKLYTKRTIE